MFTESTMDDDIAHFAIAPQILNLLFVIDSLHLQILRLAPRQFLANLSSGQLFCKFYFQTIFTFKLWHQVVIPDNFFADWKLSFLTPFLRIVALDFFWHILQVIDLDNFSANCCSRQLFCRLLLQTIYFANLQIVATMLQLIVPDQFVANLQIKNQPDNPTQSDHFNHPDQPEHLKHLTTLATLTTPTTLITLIIFVLH